MKKLNDPVLTHTNHGITMQDRNFSVSEAAIYDNNFDYDAKLIVSGDFADGVKEEYTNMIASVLNNYKKQIPSEVPNKVNQMLIEIIYILQDKIGSTSRTPISDAIAEIQILATKPD